MSAELRIFNKQHPYHRDLDFIADRPRTTVGDGNFQINKYQAWLMMKNGLVTVQEGQFGREVKLTAKGRRSLEQSREAFMEL